MEYCYYCGNKLRSKTTKFFNVDTGKNIIKKICINPKCQVNCEHKFGLFGLINKCIKCGYSE